MELTQNVARTLDDPAKIVGFTPVELAFCAVSNALMNMLLRGIPLGALISLGLAAALGVVVLTLNRTYPPNHGVLFLLSYFRPRVTPVMPLGLET